MDFDFKIQATGPASAAFRDIHVNSFMGAADYLMKLPYRRNLNKELVLNVLSEKCGTCSTKHALLKTLADENGFHQVQLIIGLFKMHHKNTAAVAGTLKQHRLDYLPEAHCYLKIDGAVLDITKENFSLAIDPNDIISEVQIEARQINEHKVAYHRAFLNEWLAASPQLGFSIDEIWSIREQCIQDLANADNT